MSMLKAQQFFGQCKLGENDGTSCGLESKLLFHGSPRVSPTQNTRNSESYSLSFPFLILYKLSY